MISVLPAAGRGEAILCMLGVTSCLPDGGQHEATGYTPQQQSTGDTPAMQQAPLVATVRYRSLITETVVVATRCLCRLYATD